MALEATHIRLALDLSEKYQVKDIQRCIVGTLYPDTRYTTRIPRELTHPPEFMEWDILNVDDFKKGWYMHLLCDKIQGAIIKEKFPEIFLGEPLEMGNLAWVGITAIKTLQDLEDMKEFDVSQHLPDLTLIEHHNNEDPDKVRKFYEAACIVYSNPKAITLETYKLKMLELGLPEALAESVNRTTTEYQDKPGALELVRGIYPEMLQKILDE